MARNYSKTKNYDRNSTKVPSRFQSQEKLDWKCNSCWQYNRPYHSYCGHCNTTRSVANNSKWKKTKNPKAIKEELGGNDWLCPLPKCQFVNRCYATVCLKCNTTKPDKQNNFHSSRNVIKREHRENPKDSTQLERSLAKYGLPTSFGAVLNTFGDNVPVIKQSNPTTKKDGTENSMSVYGLPSAFGGSEKHVVGPSGDQGDNWICSHCESSNRQCKSSCFKCNYPKSCRVTRNWQENKRNNVSTQCDWMCYACSKTSKGFPNRHYRVSCYRCNEPKGYTTTSNTNPIPAKVEWMEQYQEDVKYFQHQYKEDDWYCSPCGNLVNDNTRSTCYKCKQPKNYLNYKNGNQSAGDESWKCQSCNEINIDSKNNCKQCGQMQKNGLNNGSAIHKLEPGKDWWCSICKSSNLYDRDSCFRCNSIQPRDKNDRKDTSQPRSTENIPKSKSSNYCSNIPPPPLLKGNKIWLDNAKEERQETCEEKSKPNLETNDSVYNSPSQLKGLNRVINKTSSINPDLFFGNQLVLTKSCDKKIEDSKIAKTVLDNFETGNAKADPKTENSSRIISSYETSRRRRTSTPADPNCSPFSVATAVCSPLTGLLARIPEDVNPCLTSSNSNKNGTQLSCDNIDQYTKKPFADNHNGSVSQFNFHASRKRILTKDSSCLDSPQPALQIASRRYKANPQGVLKSRRSEKHVTQNRKKRAENELYDIQEAHQFNRQADKTKISVKNRQISPYKNQSFVSDVNKINDLQEDLNTSSVIECNHDTDLHKFYAERKRQAEEDNVKEIESQRPIRDKLAALAGGYLTADGISTGKYAQPQFSQRNKSNDIEEVVVIDDDHDDIVTVLSDTSKDGSVQRHEGSKCDKKSEESDELNRVLHSNLPDDEKASRLAKFGIKIKKPEINSRKRKTTRDQNMWLVEKVAETDKALASDNSKSTAMNKNSKVELIVID